MAGGAALGYWVTRRHLEIEFQKRLDQQIDNADDFYRRKYEKKLKEQRTLDGSYPVETVEVVRTSETSDAEDAQQENEEKLLNDPSLRSVLTNYQGMADAEMAPSEYVKSVLVPEPEDEDIPEPTNSSLPVIISEEAYMEQVSGFNQLSRTYYAGDDILATEQNKIVSDSVRKNTVGVEVLELLKMGVDRNKQPVTVVYVRNKELSMEYEIFREPGMYTEEVGPIGSVE